jgi:hypothetical protein
MVGAVVPYGLSVHGFIDKVGNYAGFAAVIAVALLVIMVFVGARESAALRDRAEDAEDRLYRLEYHAEQLSRSAAAAAPPAPVAQAAAPGLLARGAAAATPLASPAVAVAAPPAAARRAVPAAAPAGVAAPALSSATRLIPLREPAEPAEPAGSSNGVSSSVPVAPAPSTTAGAGGGAIIAAGGNGVTPAPAPAPALALTPVGASVPPPPRLTPRPPAAPAPGRAPRRNYGRAAEQPGSRIGKGSVAIAVVLLAVIAVAAVLVINHHGSGSGHARPAADRGGHPHRSGTHKTKGTLFVNPTKVTVAVLNGTSTSNLAADVSAKLNHVGFQQGDTLNYSDQTQATTTVGYLPGYSAQGYAVAKALGLGRAVVHRVNTAARDIACAATPTTCPDQVVVTVGADLESDA